MLQKLKCNKNGDFTVLVVADPQCEKEFQWKEAADELEILLKKEEPDFVLINGDMETNNLITKENWGIFIQPIIERKIFWSTVNGNHDPFKKEINDMYLEFDKCLNTIIENERPLNYCIPVLGSKEEKIAFAIYGMDSGDSFIDDGWTGYTKKQLEWYRNCSEELKTENNGVSVTSMMCCHIPLQEVVSMEILHGVCNENMGRTSKALNVGTFEAIKEQGDVKILVFGHSHKINVIGKLDGILMGYAGKISSGSYHDEFSRGGRIVKFNENEPSKVVTYWSGVLPTSKDQPAVVI